MITTNSQGYLVNSQLTGLFEEKIMRISYQLQLDQQWQTLSLQANSRCGEQSNTLSFTSDSHGSWMFNNQPVTEFNGCIDVDISVTPFTNTLPINRLKLANNASQEISVVYINLPGEELYVMKQQYTRLSDREYLYQNVSSNFEAKISVDENGVVINYPGIFELLQNEDL